MLKLSKITMVLAIIGCVGTSFNLVRAEEVSSPYKHEFECIFDKDVYYEGETINMTFNLADEYTTSEDKITDLEMTLLKYTEEGSSILKLNPVLEGAKSATNNMENSIYYIQTAPMSEKIRLNGGETIANGQYKLDENIFSTDATQEGKKVDFGLDGYTYWTNGDSGLIVEYYETNIVPYEVGDITRDHEVDFFDITELISVVYDKDQNELDWRQKYSITANTDKWWKLTGKDFGYDYKNAKLAFMDIIFLVREVYG